MDTTERNLMSEFRKKSKSDAGGEPGDPLPRRNLGEVAGRGRQKSPDGGGAGSIVRRGGIGGSK